MFKVYKEKRNNYDLKFYVKANAFYLFPSNFQTDKKYIYLSKTLLEIFHKKSLGTPIFSISPLFNLMTLSQFAIVDNL